MEKKSKEQLRVEEYFEENNIVHNGNYIYATRQERNLNSFWLLGLSGLLFKSAQPYYILFREDEILFFKMKVLGGIKELSFIMKVEDIKSIVLKKGLLSYSLIIKVETDGKIKKELINLRNLNFCHDKVCIFKYLAYLCSDKFRSRGLLIASQFSQTNDEYPNCQ